MRILKLIFFCYLTSTTLPTHAADRYFNSFILRAVDKLANERQGQGYDNYSYTRDLRFGDETLKASNPPLTMCVAAQIEILVEALTLYAADRNDPTVFKWLPIQQWRALQSHTFRGKVWIADPKASRGTADALSDFGMGKVLPFSQLKPGAFLNLNRVTHKGHAVVFLGYLNAKGQGVDNYGPDVAGFKYFSSQGTRQTGGFGYRYAFFDKKGCPVLPKTMKRDCGVIESENQTLLNTGQMLMPSLWNKAKRSDALERARASARGPALPFNADFFDGVTTDD